MSSISKKKRRQIEVKDSINENNTQRFITKHSAINSVVCFMEGVMCGMGIKYYISDNSSSNKEFYTFDAHIDGFFSDNQWNLFRKRIEKGLLSKDASNYVQSIVTFY